MNELLKSQFLSLYCMVLADGVIDVKELEMLYKIGREQYGFRQEEINAVVITSGTTFLFPESVEEKMRFIYNLTQIAYADGEIDDNEKNLLKKYILRLGYSDKDVDAITEFFIEQVINNVSIDVILKDL